MARLYPLFSSSKGNASFVGTPEGGILVDCGVSVKRLSQGLARCGISLEAIEAVFVTHAHTDHVSGLKVLLHRRNVPVYTQRLTAQKLLADGILTSERQWREIRAGETTLAAGYEVTPFETPHDAEQSCGFRVACPDGRVCGFCTDLGTVNDTVLNALRGCHLVLLEANYDPYCLSHGRYPQAVKARIAAPTGHLSNASAAAAARELVAGGTKVILLGHLSRENNTPERARETVSEALKDFSRPNDYILEVLKPEGDGEMKPF